ncbi:hypothetical protein BSNK01_06180 [Bacillaceae bacterium]
MEDERRRGKRARQVQEVHEAQAAGERGGALFIVLCVSFLALSALFQYTEYILSAKRVFVNQENKIRAQYVAEAGVALLQEKVAADGEVAESFPFALGKGNGEVRVVSVDEEKVTACVTGNWPPHYQQVVWVQIDRKTGELIGWWEQRHPVFR